MWKLLSSVIVKKKIAMAWIDYTKAFDMVPHLWIKECLKLIVWKSGE